MMVVSALGTHDTGRRDDRHLDGETRPWGSFAVLSDAPTHKVKRLEVAPGMRLSYQRHFRRAEHWFVVSGRATVLLDGLGSVLDAGDAIDIPCRSFHRVSNEGPDTLVLIEVQVGEYFGEDDIERVEDDFGRI